jgi:nitrous oxidase accessory protein NosD
MQSRTSIYALLVMIFLGANLPCAANTYYKRLFERGAYMMEAQANPEGAIPIFQEIVKRHPNDRHYASRAQFYLGLCYKRLGSDLAVPALQDVINNFSDQVDIVKLAESELLPLANSQSIPRPALTEDRPFLVWSGQGIFGTKTLSPDGRFFTYVSLDTGRLFLVELEELKPSLVTNRRESPKNDYVDHGTVSHDSKWIAYSSHDPQGQSELWIYSPEERSSRLLCLSEGRQTFQPLGWTPESDRILVRSTEEDFNTHIAWVDVLDGRKQHVSDLSSLWPDRMILSPDGRYLAYSAHSDTAGSEKDIYLLNLSTHREVPLVLQPGDNFLLGWSADSTNILYTATEAGIVDAWALSIWKGTPRQPARRIKVDIGHFTSLGLAPEGTLYFEKKQEPSRTSKNNLISSEIWAWKDFFSLRNQTLTVPDDYPTIQSAISAADPWDTVYIKNGIYVENIIVGKPVALQGEDQERTIIDGGGGEAVIHIAASYVYLDALTIQNGAQGINHISNRPAHHMTLKNCVMTRNSHEGLLSRNSGGFHLIENCQFSHNGGYAINAHQFSQSTIRNCNVFRNAGGIRVGWGWYIHVVGNQLHHNFTDGLYPDSCYYSTFERNLIYANRRLGIKMGHISSRNTIRENIVANNEEGIRIGVEWGKYSENRFYHNDLIDNQIQLGEGQSGIAGFQYWDNGMPRGGNFWSDSPSTSTDKSRTVQTAHEPVAGAFDNHPLTTPRNRLQALLYLDPSSFSPVDRKEKLRVCIRLPAEIPVENIDPETVRLNESLLAEKNGFELEDTDGDGISEMWVEFNGKMADRILPGGPEIEIIVTGRLKNGLPFAGQTRLKTGLR